MADPVEDERARQQVAEDNARALQAVADARFRRLDDYVVTFVESTVGARVLEDLRATSYYDKPLVEGELGPGAEILFYRNEGLRVAFLRILERIAQGEQLRRQRPARPA